MPFLRDFENRMTGFQIRQGQLYYFNKRARYEIFYNILEFHEYYINPILCCFKIKITSPY